MLINKGRNVAIIFFIYLLIVGCSVVQNATQDTLRINTPTYSSESIPESTNTIQPDNPEDEILGTRWTVTANQPGKGSIEFTIIFMGEGKLAIFEKDDITPTDDTWEMNGIKVFISFNNGEEIYDGKIIGKEEIVGKASNKQGMTWDWSAYQQE